MKIKFGAAIIAALFFATAAQANLLVNPGFEDAPFAGAEEAGAGFGWSPFGGTFRIQGQPPIGPAGAHGGDVVLKVFGVAGAFQDFAASEGDLFNASAWALNDSADVMTGGQVAAVNIEWHGAGGFIDFVAGTTLTSASPVDIWTLLTAAGAAPAGTTFARFVVITGDFAGPGGGAPRFDDASFTLVPIPAAAWLMLSGIGALVGFRRKRA